MMSQILKSLALVPAFTWLLMPIAPCAAQMAEKERSSQREARCLLNLSWSSGSVHLNEEVLFSMAKSSEVLSAAFASSRDADPDLALVEGRLDIDMAVLHHGEPFESSMVVEMEISLADSFAPTTPARQAMLAICDQLDSAIHQIHEANLRHSAQRLDMMKSHRAEAETRLEELQQLRRQLLEESGRADLSAEVITEELTELARDKRHLDMELHTRRIRQAMLEQRVAKISADLEARADGDAILHELTRVVEIHEQNLARYKARHEAKMVASSPEFSEAQEQLAHARVELLQARKEVVQQVGGHALGAYNSELAQASMQAAELEAQISFLEERKEEIRAKRLFELADKFDKEVAIQLPIAKDNLAEACEELDEIAKQLRMLTPPRLGVIGRKDKMSKE